MFKIRLRTDNALILRQKLGACTDDQNKYINSLALKLRQFLYWHAVLYKYVQNTNKNIQCSLNIKNGICIVRCIYKIIIRYVADIQ